MLNACLGGNGLSFLTAELEVEKYHHRAGWISGQFEINRSGTPTQSNGLCSPAAGGTNTAD